MRRTFSAVLLAGSNANVRRVELAWGAAIAAEWAHFVCLGVFAYKTGGTSAVGLAGLVRLHQRRAYIVARSIVLTHEDAEDAVQEGFLRAHQALDRFDTSQTFGAWLNRIVANAALDLARRRKVRNAEELSESIPSTFRDPAEGGELRERLADAMKKLPERARAVIVLHDVEGFTHAEIGEMLGIPGGTARSDLHHARQKLRVLLGNLRD